MAPSASAVERLVRDGLAAVAEARGRAHLARAWDLLQERDSDGNPRGCLPYTDAALAELHAAHRRDPEDIAAVHHLAIAQHARAWDLELVADRRAAAAWKEALGWWRIVAASGPFWAALKEKLRACDPDADPAWLDLVRGDLLENLLEVHVDFVRHYCEANDPDRATTHVTLIREARIPPVLRRRLVARVFDAMASAVPEAMAQGAYPSVLTTLERFLALFPDHLPALRSHAEAAKAWVAGLSWQTDWDQIAVVAGRAEAYARRLEAHADLSAEPLAQSALEDLAGELALRGYDKAKSYFAARKLAEIGAAERTVMNQAFDLGIRWGRLAARHSPSGGRVRMLLSGCLQNHAFILHQEAEELRTADVGVRTKLAGGLRLYRQALAETEEAQALAPDDEQLQKNLQAIRHNLSGLEEQQMFLDLEGSPGRQP